MFDFYDDDDYIPLDTANDYKYYIVGAVAILTVAGIALMVF